MTESRATRLQEYFESCQKDTLITFLLNNEYIKEVLGEKLFLLTGCSGFGSQDGTDGSCVECYAERPDQHERCCLFQAAAHSYHLTRMKEEEAREQNAPCENRMEAF